MTKKEKTAQKALGLLKSYDVLCTISLPKSAFIELPLNIDVEATSEEAAAEEALKRFKEMSPVQRKNYVWDNMDDEMFNEMNSDSDQDTLQDDWDNAQKVLPNKYVPSAFAVISVNEDGEE